MVNVSPYLARLGDFLARVWKVFACPWARKNFPHPRISAPQARIDKEHIDFYEALNSLKTYFRMRRNMTAASNPTVTNGISIVAIALPLLRRCTAMITKTWSTIPYKLKTELRTLPITGIKARSLLKIPSGACM